MRIALDAMGGDHGIPVVLPAAEQALARHPELKILLVGDEARLLEGIARYGGLETARRDGRCDLRHAEQVVSMGDKPASALRNKRRSSMRLAIEAVRDGDADAAVSAGNTGALMAIARFVLKTHPGIDRPAICAAMPGAAGHTLMLDLGANVDAPPETLLQFAIMGSVLSSALEGKSAPSVALLNIGEEEIKGGEGLRAAAELITEAGLNYAGFVEGNHIFDSRVDVIVCDGFSGNVALKASEGTAKLISQGIREAFTRTWFSRFAALISRPILAELRSRFDPRQYNGASLLGLRGIVVKSHGSADAKAFVNAIEVAIAEAANRVPERILSLLQQQAHGPSGEVRRNPPTLAVTATTITTTETS